MAVCVCYCVIDLLSRAPASYTILYYATLYYTILYYASLYYTILYSTLLYYTILYYTILYYTILYYTILYYTIYVVLLCSIVTTSRSSPLVRRAERNNDNIVAIFYPFALFCEIVSSLLSLQNHQEQPSIYFRRR